MAPIDWHRNANRLAHAYCVIIIALCNISGTAGFLYRNHYHHPIEIPHNHHHHGRLPRSTRQRTTQQQQQQQQQQNQQRQGLDMAFGATRLTTVSSSLTTTSSPYLSSSSSSIGNKIKTTCESPVVWKYIQECFQGDFDNYDQVVHDRERGLLPREGGGHEHIHCTLLPLEGIGLPHARLAAFYFDGLPQRIFRFRYYELEKVEATTEEEEDAVITKLYLLHPQLEAILRGEEDPLEWPRHFESFVPPRPNDSGDTIDQPKTRILVDCDVRWTLEKDAIQQEWDEDITTQHDHGIHAAMLHGEALVDSTMFPGSKIRVVDQLSLWSNHFWIHDRGFDPLTGAYIYGNQAGVPYRLERVTAIRHGKRNVVNASLQWTLGPSWRTPDEYQTKMTQIGGASTKMNNK